MDSLPEKECSKLFNVFGKVSVGKVLRADADQPA